ncbi:MAG: hypothetical protein Q7T29_04830, partial [Gallionella sp.]|nr:hypothetical protein [Gallionella sp.]
TIKSPAAVAPAEDLPYETRRAQQNFPVTLYVAENCTEYCDQARELLIKRGIPFSENCCEPKKKLMHLKHFTTSTACLRCP